MPTQKSKPFQKRSVLKQILGLLTFVLLLGLSAQVSIDTGFLVSFTLQTLILGVFYFYFPRRLRIIGIMTYIAIGVLGLPVFSNAQSGWTHLTGWSLGFFLGFILAAFLKPFPSNRYSYAFGYFIQLHVIIVICGLVVFGVKGQPLQAILDNAISFAPGIVLKSVAGAGIVWFLNKYLPFNSSYTW